jgi:hypothetical protein
MEAVNVQTDEIAKVVCAFMSAATPVNVVKTFKALVWELLSMMVCSDAVPVRI